MPAVMMRLTGWTRSGRRNYAVPVAPIAQLVEQETFNLRVPGSIPGGGTKKPPPALGGGVVGSG